MYAYTYANATLRAIIGGAGAILGFLFGEWDGMIIALLSMNAVDFLSGIIVAAIRKQIDSRAMYAGAAKKLGMLSLVICANIIDGLIGLNGILRTITITYFIANEGLSLLENWGKIGLPIPKPLSTMLRQLHDDD